MSCPSWSYGGFAYLPMLIYTVAKFCTQLDYMLSFYIFIAPYFIYITPYVIITTIMLTFSYLTEHASGFTEAVPTYQWDARLWYLQRLCLLAVMFVCIYMVRTSFPHTNITIFREAGPTPI